MLQFTMTVVNTLTFFIYSCDTKLNFQHPSSVSHDPSEIILICGFNAHETFLIILIIVFVNSCLMF